MSEYLRKGYLLKCPQKARAFKKWNSRWFVLYGNSPRGRVRLEYYDSEKAWQQERGKRIIPLVHCVSIKPVWNKEYNHVLEIVTSDKTFYLGAGSKEEEKAWFKSLCKIVFGNANRSSIVQVLDRPDPIDLGYHSLDRGTGDDSNLSRSQSSSLAQSSPQLTKISGSREKIGLDVTGLSDLNVTESSVETRNATSSLSCELSSLVSFESGFDDSASVISSVTEGYVNNYHVTVRPTIASQEAGMTGQYVLQITPISLVLKEMGTEQHVAEWPIQHLRRYGRGRTKFSFEAGDKCKTGVGVYTFNTKEGDQIFHLIDTHARKLSNHKENSYGERRMPFHAQSFKPLSESRRRAKSEGRLLESSDDSTINELSESLDNVAKPFNSTSNGTYPSKNRLRTLDVIEDHEATERQHDASVIVRPRFKTDVNSSKDFTRVFEVEDQNKPGESMESLLQNPANSDFNSVETVKEQTESSNETGSLCNELGVQQEKETSSDLELNLSRSANTVDNNEAEIPCNPVTKIEENPETDSSSTLARLRSESPFDPLSTSEPNARETPEKSDKEPAETDFHINGIDSTDNEENKHVFNDTKEINHDSNDLVNLVDDDSVSVEEKIESVETKKSVLGLARVKSLETERKQTWNDRSEDEFPRRRRSRKLAQRNKSFEFGSQSDKAVDNKKHSGSFSSFDYRKYRENNEPLFKADNSKRIQRFASVKKTVEMYEKISMAANEARQKSFTLWKRKSFKTSQKPDVGKRSNDTST